MATPNLDAHEETTRPGDRRRATLRFPILCLAGALSALACSSTTPEPKQPMADTEGAIRSAREVGADKNPAAKLRANLADEELTAAKNAVAGGDNARATSLVTRARADADLALALAREQSTLEEKQKAVEAATARANTTGQGAKP